MFYIRRERHKIGPEEIQDWKQEFNDDSKDSWLKSGNIMDNKKYNIIYDNSSNSIHYINMF